MLKMTRHDQHALVRSLLSTLVAVENVAYGRQSWIGNRRAVSKRHVRARWRHPVHAGRAVDGLGGGGGGAGTLDSCTVLDNFDVDRPVWMVNLGRKVHVAGVVILTWPDSDAAAARAHLQTHAGEPAATVVGADFHRAMVATGPGE